MRVIETMQRKQELVRFEKALREQAAVEGKDVGDIAEAFVTKQIEDKKLNPETYNWRALFEAFVNPDGMLDISRPDKVAKAVEASLYPRITQPMAVAVVNKTYNYEIGDLLSLFVQEDANHSASEELVGLNNYGDLQLRKPTEAYERSKPFDESYKAFYKDYGIILDITMEEMMDDKNNLLTKKLSSGGTKQGKKLAQVLCQTIEMASTRSAFNETTNTAYTRNGTSISTAGAGSSTSAVYYAFTTHAAIDGQVNINAISDTFSSDSVKVANQYLQRMTDPVGDKIQIRPTKIITHEILSQEVNEFLRASTRYDQMEPTPNFWSGKLQNVSSPYFTSESIWFFGSPEQEARIRWVERPQTVTMTGLTKDEFERRIVQSWRHNLYFGAFHSDYRFLIRAGSAS